MLRDTFSSAPNPIVFHLSPQPGVRHQSPQRRKWCESPNHVPCPVNHCLLLVRGVLAFAVSYRFVGVTLIPDTYPATQKTRVSLRTTMRPTLTTQDSRLTRGRSRGSTDCSSTDDGPIMSQGGEPKRSATHHRSSGCGTRISNAIPKLKSAASLTSSRCRPLKLSFKTRYGILVLLQ